MTTMRGKWKRLLALALTCTMLTSSNVAGSLPVYAENLQEQEALAPVEELQSQVQIEEIQYASQNEQGSDIGATLNEQKILSEIKTLETNESAALTSPDSDDFVTLEWNPKRTIDYMGALGLEFKQSGWNEAICRVYYCESADNTANATFLNEVCIEETSNVSILELREIFERTGYYYAVLSVGDKYQISDLYSFKCPNEKLPTVTNLYWEKDENGTITNVSWDVDENVGYYIVKLLRNGNICYSRMVFPYEVEGTAQLFNNYIKKDTIDGIYTFTVQPIVKEDDFGINYANGEVSKPSDPLYMSDAINPDAGPENVSLNPYDGMLYFTTSDTDGAGVTYTFTISRDSYYVNSMNWGCGVENQGKDITFPFAHVFTSDGYYSCVVTVYKNGEPINYIAAGGFDYKVPSKRLETPLNLRWEGKKAVWDTVNDAKYYIVTLFKDGQSYASNMVSHAEMNNDGTVTDDNPSKRYMDYSTMLQSKSKYAFTVKACPKNIKTHFTSANAKSIDYLSWDYLCEGQTLYYNGSEESKTTTVFVAQNGGTTKPVYTSSDTNVATVKADSWNPNKAVITATGVGEAIITITVDGEKKSFPISVENLISLEGVSLNKTKVSLNAGDTTTLSLLAEPLNYEFVDTDAIEWLIEEDNNVIEITPSDDKKSVQITATDNSGEAIVKVTVRNGEQSYTNNCVVTVKKEKDMDEAIQEMNANPFVKIVDTDSDNTLSSIKLPEHWKWCNPTQVLQANDLVPIQHFDAVYQEEGYEKKVVSLPVAVSKIKGIHLSGDDTMLYALDEKEYKLCFDCVGYPISSIDTKVLEDNFDIKWDFSKAPYLEKIENEDNLNIVKLDTIFNDWGEAYNEFDGLTKEQILNVSLVNKKTKVSFKTTFKLVITNRSFVNQIYVADLEEYNIVSMNSLYKPVPHDLIDETDSTPCQLIINKKDIPSNSNMPSVQLEVQSYHTMYYNMILDDEIVKNEWWEKGSDVSFKYESSDTNVVEVKAGRSIYIDHWVPNILVIKAKNPGTAEIRITAADGGNYTKVIQVTIRDGEPVLESNKFTLNRSVENDSVLLPIRALNGTEIETVELEDGENSYLEVKEKDAAYYLQLKSGLTAEQLATFNSLKKIDAKLAIKTEVENVGSEENIVETYDKDISVSFVDTIPAVSFKQQTKANLFYKGTTSKWSIVTGAQIDRIEEKDNTPVDGFHLVTPTQENLAKGEITFEAQTLDASNLKTFNKKITLLVYFENYTKPKEVTVTVGTENKKPSLKIRDIVLKEQDNDILSENPKVWIDDTVAKKVFDLTDTTVTQNPDDKTNMDVIQEGNDVSLTYNETKTKSYKLDLTNDNWTASITLAGKVTVAKQKELVLGKNKITLNKETTVAKNGTLEIPVSVKGSDATITKITYKTDKNSAFLVNDNHLYIVYNEEQQKLKIGLNNNISKSNKKGNYKLTIGAVDSQGEELKAATLTINLTDKKPTLSLKAKGSIDLIQRENSSIIYTPTVANVESTISSVELTGNYTTYFDAEVTDEGTIELSATDRNMSTSMNYPVGMKVELENGVEVELSKPVNVKPVNKVPKITASTTKATLYKGTDTKIPISLKLAPENAEIEKIELVEDKNSKFFDLQSNAEKQAVTIGLSEAAKGMKAGNYTVSYKVYFKGAAYNVKPTVVKCSIAVKNK